MNLKLAYFEDYIMFRIQWDTSEQNQIDHFALETEQFVYFRFH